MHHPLPDPSVTAAEAIDILVVDDDEAIRTVLIDALRRQGYSFRWAPNGKAALALLATSSFRLVITDIYMPDTDGLELIMKYQAAVPCAPILAISGGGQRGGPADMLKPARLLGCQRTLAKPFELSEFLAAVRELIG